MCTNRSVIHTRSAWLEGSNTVSCGMVSMQRQLLLCSYVYILNSMCRNMVQNFQEGGGAIVYKAGESNCGISK